MFRWMHAAAVMLAALMFLLPRDALAGRFLFVSDTNTDNNIPTVLRADGHTVEVVTNDYNTTTTNNARLQMPIGAFDAVFWSATGGGAGAVHAAATFTNLASYVTGGGRVFVTGYDSIASPLDPPLVAFLGGTGSIDVPGAPGPVASVANALTTGVVDIRGVTPTGASGDRDSLTGVMAGTVIVVPTTGSATEGQWVLRTLGTGLIAYVSNGDSGPTSAHPSWEATAAGGAGAYNAALRNFARNASRVNVLFVSDVDTDNNIPTVLRGDGHTVTVVTNDYNATSTNNARLQGSLAGFDVVVWSATGEGFGSVHAAATFTNLASYVTAGGRVFVTGYDSIASPLDPPLVSFLGGTGARDVPGAPGPVASVANALTTGVVDIRGVTPTGVAGDRDALTGVMAGTAIVVSSADPTTEGQWVLRTLGTGLIAYVSNGDAGPTSAHPSWATTAPLAAGAYNAALRNFVGNARGSGPPVPMLQPNGATCAAGSECMSSFCVDGVCCNNACAGGTTDCQACAMAAGAPANGTCAPIAAGRACRASAGACDVAETCDGTATACPADAFASRSTVCRPAVAGGCDVAEMCSGTAAACPADAVSPAMTMCRMSTGACDLAEVCDGTSNACPADRAAMDGTACNDSMTCNGAETCRGGMCVAGTPLDCDDRDPCTTDSCVEVMGCVRTPILGCGIPDAGSDAAPDVAADAAADSAVADAAEDVAADVAADAAADAAEDVADAATTDAPAGDATPDVTTPDAAPADVEIKDVVRPDAAPADVATSDASGNDASASDASVTDDTGLPKDGAVELPSGSSSSGCGCAVPGRSDRSPTSLLALAGLAALLGARRRRSAR